MRQTTLRLTALLSATALVSACGGGSKTVLNPGPNGLPFAQAGLTLNQGFITGTYSGIPFTTKASSSRSTLNGGATGFNNAQLESSGDVTVTVLSSPLRIRISSAALGTRTLTATGGTGANGETLFDDGAGTTGLFGVSGAGTTNQSVFFAYVNETAAAGGINFSDTFLVSGLETDSTSVAAQSNPTATYTGPAQMLTRQTNGATINGPLNVLNSPTGLNLNVDFSAASNQVTGTISGATDAGLGGGTMTLTLVPATITGNSFSTTFTAAHTGQTGTAIGMSNTQLTGVFYGNNADEMGGTFNAQLDVSGTNIPETTNGSGFFLGQD